LCFRRASVAPAPVCAKAGKAIATANHKIRAMFRNMVPPQECRNCSRGQKPAKPEPTTETRSRGGIQKMGRNSVFADLEDFLRGSVVGVARDGGSLSIHHCRVFAAVVLKSNHVSLRTNRRSGKAFSSPHLQSLSRSLRARQRCFSLRLRRQKVSRLRSRPRRQRARPRPSASRPPASFTFQISTTTNIRDN